MIAGIKAKAQKEDDEFNILNDNLHKEWGRAYDQKVHLGNKAIDKGVKGDEGLRERVTEKINNDPDLIKLVSNLGGMFSEETPFEEQRIDTPSDLQTQINEIMDDPRYMSKDKAVRMPLINRVMRLREQMNKDMKKTG
jgi:hypothetical protein